MDAMNGLAWPVVAAAVIGIGVLGVREPKKFNRLSPWLLGATSLAATVLLFWTNAYQAGAQAAFEHAKALVDKQVGITDP
ncbi:hypothetical protein [Mesorhizobium loti]|uniref:hypothetical protein n=1 Tax=Rhizobium loti TaxID=381 RepID=UPI00047EBF90|nr:hypothetical protein [Mesorhizobium loti]